MTNRDELAKLADPEYQKTAAQGIFNAVLEAVKRRILIVRILIVKEK